MTAAIPGDVFGARLGALKLSRARIEVIEAHRRIAYFAKLPRRIFLKRQRLLLHRLTDMKMCLLQPYVVGLTILAVLSHPLRGDEVRTVLPAHINTLEPVRIIDLHDYDLNLTGFNSASNQMDAHLLSEIMLRQQNVPEAMGILFGLAQLNRNPDVTPAEVVEWSVGYSEYVQRQIDASESNELDKLLRAGSNAVDFYNSKGTRYDAGKALFDYLAEIAKVPENKLWDSIYSGAGDEVLGKPAREGAKVLLNPILIMSLESGLNDVRGSEFLRMRLGDRQNYFARNGRDYADSKNSYVLQGLDERLRTIERLLPELVGLVKEVRNATNKSSREEALTRLAEGINGAKLARGEKVAKNEKGKDGEEKTDQEKEEDRQFTQQTIQGVGMAVDGIAKLVAIDNPKLGRAIGITGRFGTSVALALTVTNPYLAAGMIINAFGDLMGSILGGPSQLDMILEQLNKISKQLENMDKKIDHLGAKIDDMDRRHTFLLRTIFYSMHERFARVLQEMKKAEFDSAERDRQIQTQLNDLDHKIDLVRSENRDQAHTVTVNEAIRHAINTSPNIYGTFEPYQIRDLNENLNLLEQCATNLALDAQNRASILNFGASAAKNIEDLGKMDVSHYVDIDHALLRGSIYDSLTQWNQLFASINKPNKPMEAIPNAIVLGICMDAMSRVAEYLTKPGSEGLEQQVRDIYREFDGFGQRDASVPKPGTRLRDLAKTLRRTQRALRQLRTSHELRDYVFQEYAEEIHKLESEIAQEHATASPYKLWEDPTQRPIKAAQALNGDNTIHNCDPNPLTHAEFPIDEEIRALIARALEDRHRLLSELGMASISVCYRSEIIPVDPMYQLHRGLYLDYNRYAREILKLTLVVKIDDTTLFEVPVQLEPRIVHHQRTYVRNLTYPVYRLRGGNPDDPTSYENKGPSGEDFTAGNYARFMGPHDAEVVGRLMRQPGATWGTEKWRWWKAAPYNWEQGPQGEQANESIWSMSVDPRLGAKLSVDQLLALPHGTDSLNAWLSVERNPPTGESNQAVLFRMFKDGLRAKAEPAKRDAATFQDTLVAEGAEEPFAIAIANRYKTFFYSIVLKARELRGGSPEWGSETPEALETLRKFAEQRRDMEVVDASKYLDAKKTPADQKKKLLDAITQGYSAYLDPNCFGDYLHIALKLYHEGELKDVEIALKIMDSQGNGEAKFLRIADRLTGLQRMLAVGTMAGISEPMPSADLKGFREGGTLRTWKSVSAVTQREVPHGLSELYAGSVNVYNGDMMRLAARSGVPLRSLDDPTSPLDNTVTDLMRKRLAEARKASMELQAATAEFVSSHPIIDVPLERIEKVLKFIDEKPTGSKPIEGLLQPREPKNAVKTAVRLLPR